MRKITRQLYFYDVKLATYTKENGFVDSKDFKNDMQNLFKSFNGLPFDKENLKCSMYLKKINGTYDFIEIDTINENYIEGKLINTDDTGLTRYEENGRIGFLKDTMSTTASIAEVSHFVIFLDTRYMVFEYNAKSSHVSSLENYIREKMDFYWIDFENLLNRNTKNKFNSLKQVKSFKFSTSSRYLLSKDASNQGFFKAASAVFDLTNRDTDVEQNITIEIKPKKITKKNKKPYYDAEELKVSISDLNLNTDENVEDYFKLDIVGMNELNEQIVVNYSKDILKTSMTLEPNMIESCYFYKKMKEAYNKTYNKYIK